MRPPMGFLSDHPGTLGGTAAQNVTYRWAAPLPCALFDKILAFCAYSLISSEFQAAIACMTIKMPLRVTPNLEVSSGTAFWEAAALAFDMQTDAPKAVTLARSRIKCQSCQQLTTPFLQQLHIHKNVSRQV